MADNQEQFQEPDLASIAVAPPAMLRMVPDRVELHRPISLDMPASLSSPADGDGDLGPTTGFWNYS